MPTNKLQSLAETAAILRQIEADALALLPEHPHQAAKLAALAALLREGSQFAAEVRVAR